MFIEITAADIYHALVYCVSAIVILGHNLWLVAEDDGSEIKLEAVTSDQFPKSDTAIRPERIADFRICWADGFREVADYRSEDRSLVAYVKRLNGFDLAALELQPHPITLEAEKFAGYIMDESAEASVAPRFIAGETETPQRESYSKFAKVVLNGAAFDRIVGHRLEIVLRKNPTELEPGEMLPVTVLFDGGPAPNLRVTSGAENANEGRYAAHASTDEKGSATVEIPSKGLCYLRTHLIRPHTLESEFEWESFWASVTFRA